MSLFDSADFSTTGSFYWPVPHHVTDVIVTMAGGGGGGSGGNTEAASGGGGASAFQLTSHLRIPPGTDFLTIIVGAGGAGGSARSDGGMDLGYSGDPSKLCLDQSLFYLLLEVCVQTMLAMEVWGSREVTSPL